MLGTLYEDPQAKSENTVKTLGTFTAIRGLHVAWTVNISPTAKVNMCIQGKRRKGVWGQIGPNLQFRYFRDEYIPKVVLPNVHGYEAIVEFTKIGNLHMHLHAYIADPYPQYALHQLRVNVNMMTLTQSLVKGGRWITLNHIVPCDESHPVTEWIEYLSKAQDTHPFPSIVRPPVIQMTD